MNYDDALNDMPPAATPPIDTLLTDYALGELSDAERAEVERRLATSDELRHELEDLTQLAGLLRTATLGGEVVEVDALSESVATVAAGPELRTMLEAHLAAPAEPAAAGASRPVAAKPVRKPRLPEEVARRRSTAWAVAASIGVLVTGFGAMALVDSANHRHEAPVVLIDRSESSDPTARGHSYTVAQPVYAVPSSTRDVSFIVAKPTYQNAPVPAPSGGTAATGYQLLGHQGQGTLVLNGASPITKPVSTEPEFVPYSSDLQLFDKPDLSSYGNGVRSPTGWFGKAEYLNWSVGSSSKMAVGNPAVPSIQPFDPGSQGGNISGGTINLRVDRREQMSGAAVYGVPGSDEYWAGDVRLAGPGGGGATRTINVTGPTNALTLQPTVQEAQTGRYMLGVGINSNAGLLGSIVLDENASQLLRGGVAAPNLNATTVNRPTSLRVDVGAVNVFTQSGAHFATAVPTGTLGESFGTVGTGSLTKAGAGNSYFDYGAWIQMGWQDRADGAFTDYGPLTNQHDHGRLNLNQLHTYVSSPNSLASGAEFKGATLGTNQAQALGWVNGNISGPIVYSPEPALSVRGLVTGSSSAGQGRIGGGARGYNVGGGYSGGMVILNGSNTYVGGTILGRSPSIEAYSTWNGGHFEYADTEINAVTGGVTINDGTLTFKRSDSAEGEEVNRLARDLAPSTGLPAGLKGSIGGFNNFRFVGDGFDDNLDGDAVYGRFGRNPLAQKGLTFTNPLDGIADRENAPPATTASTASPSGKWSFQINNWIQLPALQDAGWVAAGHAPTPARSPEIEKKLETVALSLQTASQGEVAELAKLPEGRELGRLAAAKQELYEERLIPLLAKERAARSVSAVDEVKDLEQKVIAAAVEIEGLERLQEREVERVRLWKEAEARDGSQFHTDAFDSITENPFVRSTDEPLSTFSIDVDTASYSIVRKMLRDGVRPPRGAVRLEEFINYFPYDYPQPKGDDPFSVTTEAARCPWKADHVLLRVGLKGKEIHRKERPATNLVFLVDVSGSMQEPNKLPLVQQSLSKLTNELGDSDKVAIVVYAGNTGLVLDSTGGDRKQAILDAIERLNAGGSTNGGAGIDLAYKVAADNFIKGGVNRVILATDGDFNVGVTSQTELVDLIEQKAKTTGVFFSALGFGMGNLKDSTLEKLADKGNGNYAYIDDLKEAQKVLVEQMSGTLVTIAKDVKIQIEFNPNRVAAYRLLGYENRMLAAQDFNDDKKDAGEIGAGHTVTALYELIPVGKVAKKETAKLPTVDPLKYQQATTAMKPTAAAESKELLTLKLRYKQPDGDVSRLIERPVADEVRDYAHASGDFKFAASVASFGMLLRRSAYRGTATFDAALELAQEGMGQDKGGYRSEFLDMIRAAKRLAK